MITTTILTVIAGGLLVWRAYSAGKKHYSDDQNVVQDLDKEITNRLIEHGSDPEKEHAIEFAFFGDWSNMNKLKEVLLTQGYTQDSNQSDHMLIMIKKYKLHLDKIKSELQKMETMAKEYDVEFDGWSTSPIK
jgi:regulator of RNase E activity RraB